MQNIFLAITGGVLIGLAASLLMFFCGRIAGISGMLQSLITSTHSDKYNSFAFLTGLSLGAFLMSYFQDIQPSPLNLNPILIIISGLLVGYGTSLARGCTSGHGICGLSRLSVRSLCATLSFMSAGIATVFVVRHIL